MGGTDTAGRLTDETCGERVLDCGGYQFRFRNQAEFEYICREIFGNHEYGFEIDRPAPRIIDAGAHVGVATHYFKRRFPDARILALEANPVTFALLQANIAHNRLSDVDVRQAALAPVAGELPFYVATSDAAPGAWGDSAIRQAWHDRPETAVVSVPAVPLSALLTERVDLLKLDIEGLETAVLAVAGDRLRRVDRIVLEFHVTVANPDNDIARLVAILRDAGFTVEVRLYGEVVDPSASPAENLYWPMVRAVRRD
jgi:FkbM family methyltransferase